MSVGILGTLERGIPRISLGGKGIEALSRMPTKSAKGWRSWRCPDAGRCPSVGRSTFNARRSASWAGSMATAPPPPPGPRRSGRSMHPGARPGARWRRGRGAGRARCARRGWAAHPGGGLDGRRLHRHRQALGDRAARCTPGRGRALDGAEGEELGGLDALGEAGPLIPVGEALAGLDEMAPRARSWAGSMATAAPPPPGPRRSRRSMHPEGEAGCARCARRSGRSMHPGARPGARWRRGRGAGRARCALARWPRLHRHRQALGDRAARCTPGRGRRSMRPEGEAGCARCARRSGRSMRPGRGRALDGAEGEELGGLDVPWLDGHGSTATARPSAIGPLDAPRGEAGARCAPRARPDALDALGDRVARCTPGRGRALDGAEGEELGGLDALGEAGPLIPVAGSMAAGSTATARPSAIGSLDAPRGEAGRSMAPRARSWAGSMRSARLGRSSRWARRWRGSMRWRRGRGAGPARWPRPHRHRQALGDRAARCTPGRGRRSMRSMRSARLRRSPRWARRWRGSMRWRRGRGAGPARWPRPHRHRQALGDPGARCTPGRGRALDGAEGEELGGLDVPWLDGHGSTATARPSAIGPLDAPRGEAGARCAPRARPDALDALGDRVARCTPGRGRDLDGAEGEELGGLDALGEAGPLIPVAGSMAAGSTSTAGPRRSARCNGPEGEAAPLDAPRVGSWGAGGDLGRPCPDADRAVRIPTGPPRRALRAGRQGEGSSRLDAHRLHLHRQALGERSELDAGASRLRVPRMPRMPTLPPGDSLALLPHREFSRGESGVTPGCYATVTPTPPWEDP